MSTIRVLAKRPWLAALALAIPISGLLFAPPELTDAAIRHRESFPAIDWRATRGHRTYRGLGPPVIEIALTTLGQELLPRSLLFQGNNAVLLTATGTITALDISRRHIVWRSRPVGNSGRPFRSLVPIDQNTLVALPYPGDRPIRLDLKSGEVRHSLNAPTASLISGSCALRHSILLFAPELRHSVLHLRGNRFQRDDLLPWPELRESHPLQRQVLATTDRDYGVCVIALAAGGGFATISEREVQAYPYVDAPAIGEVVVTHAVDGTHARIATARLAGTYYATAVTASGGHLFVLISPRQIDVYSLLSGSYEQTLTTNLDVALLSAYGRQLALAGYRRGFPVLSLHSLAW